MGNWTKNRLLDSGSTSVVMPTGSSATRPDAPVFGQFRFNTDIGLIEFYNGAVWQSVSAGGSIAYTVDNFVGNGTTTVFTMSVPEATAQQIIVFVGSVYQIPVTNYTVNGGFDITFTSAPPLNLPVNVIHSTT
jgi:hypothetical protein